jgi:hypothetical protein
MAVNIAITALSAKVRITPPGPAIPTAFPTPKKTPAPIIIPTPIMVIWRRLRLRESSVVIRGYSVSELVLGFVSGVFSI